MKKNVESFDRNNIFVEIHIIFWFRSENQVEFLQEKLIFMIFELDSDPKNYHKGHSNWILLWEFNIKAWVEKDSVLENYF